MYGSSLKRRVVGSGYVPRGWFSVRTISFPLIAIDFNALIRSVVVGRLLEDQTNRLEKFE